MGTDHRLTQSLLDSPSRIRCGISGLPDILLNLIVSLAIVFLVEPSCGLFRQRGQNEFHPRLVIRQIVSRQQPLELLVLRRRQPEGTQVQQRGELCNTQALIDAPDLDLAKAFLLARLRDDMDTRLP